MKLIFYTALMSLCCLLLASFRLTEDAGRKQTSPLIRADNKNIQYTGRIDFSDPGKPRFWAPGVYVKARFAGTYCDVVINDEQLYGTSHNYIEVVIDDQKPFRIKLTGATNTLRVAEGLPAGAHTVTVCKDTEAGIGYLEFVGFQCARLLPPPPMATRKLEFIGDSITCGAGSDTTVLPCGQGQWYDQHNAYLSYGPTTARQLHAQWHLSAVSGIGLVHSCCGMTVAMPQVFDEMNLRDGAGTWDFTRYQPDAVTVCLGQNDGTQDPTTFRDTYVRFIGHLRSVYPKAQIICLTSPMADAPLTAFMKDNLSQIVKRVNDSGDTKVHAFFFSRHSSYGCGGHPDVAEHQLIAGELSASLKTTLGW